MEGRGPSPGVCVCVCVCEFSKEQGFIALTHLTVFWGEKYRTAEDSSFAVD